MDYYVLCISLTFKDLIYLKIYNTAQPCITATLPEVLQSLHHEPDVLRAGSLGHSSPFSVAQIQDEIGEKFRPFHAQRLECSPHREGKWALGLARSCDIHVHGTVVETPQCRTPRLDTQGLAVEKDMGIFPGRLKIYFFVCFFYLFYFILGFLFSGWEFFSFLDLSSSYILCNYFLSLQRNSFAVIFSSFFHQRFLCPEETTIRGIQKRQI